MGAYTHEERKRKIAAFLRQICRASIFSSGATLERHGELWLLPATKSVQKKGGGKFALPAAKCWPAARIGGPSRGGQIYDVGIASGIMCR